MKGNRLWYTLRLWMISSSIKRAEYVRRAIGENVSIMDRKVPLYSNKEI